MVSTKNIFFYFGVYFFVTTVLGAAESPDRERQALKIIYLFFIVQAHRLGCCCKLPVESDKLGLFYQPSRVTAHFYYSSLKLGSLHHGRILAAICRRRALARRRRAGGARGRGRRGRGRRGGGGGGGFILRCSGLIGCSRRCRGRGGRAGGRVAWTSGGRRSREAEAPGISRSRKSEAPTWRCPARLQAWFRV